MVQDDLSGKGNDLLAAVPPAERASLLQRSERVTLTQDEILGEPGEHIRQVYFPLDGFIALLAQVDDHDALAVGLVGSEGMIGAPLVLGMQTSPLRTRVQGFGNALRIKSADFLHELARAPMLERRLRRYLSVRVAQLAQTAACASSHRVEARLACWLLMAHDRAHGDRFYLTHDRLARLLGVRRSGVTTAAGVLQGRDLVRYTRGQIAILDRAGLEQMSCGCQRPRAPGAAVALAAMRPRWRALEDSARAVAVGATAPTPRRGNGTLHS